MSTAKDLSKEAPRSPKIRLGGYAIIARTIDKCRADLNGTLNGYHFDCPLDNTLFGFKGIKGTDFKEAVKKAKTDQEIVDWVNTHGTPKTPAEIKAWSDATEKSSLYSIPEKREFFATDCKRLGLNPEKTTTFDWLDTDDRTSYGKVPSATRGGTESRA